MDWNRVGTHGMQSGEYRVARNYIDGRALYVLYHGYTLLQHCNDFDECKEMAEQHAGINAGHEGRPAALWPGVPLDGLVMPFFGDGHD